MQKDFFVDYEPNRENSFWFFGLDKIAKFTYDNKEILLVEVGNIRVKYDSVYYKNKQAIDKALELNMLDKDLEKLNFGNCNYFDFYYKKFNSDYWIDVDGDEEFYYSIAIEKVKEYFRDKEFWEQF